MAPDGVGGRFPAFTPVGLEQSIKERELEQPTASREPVTAQSAPIPEPRASRSGNETPESEPSKSADSAKAQKLRDLSAKLMKKLSHDLKAEREGERDRSGSGQGGRGDD